MAELSKLKMDNSAVVSLLEVNMLMRKGKCSATIHGKNEESMCQPLTAPGTDCNDARMLSHVRGCMDMEHGRFQPEEASTHESAM